VRLLEQLGHEVRIGTRRKIHASYVRKQKTDKRDASPETRTFQAARQRAVDIFYLKYRKESSYVGYTIDKSEAATIRL